MWLPDRPSHRRILLTWTQTEHGQALVHACQNTEESYNALFKEYSKCREKSKITHESYSTIVGRFKKVTENLKLEELLNDTLRKIKAQWNSERSLRR